ncbi:TPA: MerR family DNA-binding transcriptional regulator, partial [Pseudomonas aeruginosa]
MQLIECAKAAGVTPDTLRHYLRVGLVVPDGRGTNGYR